MTSEIPDLATPIQLVTSVEGSSIRVRLAGRTVAHGVWVSGIHDPREMQNRLHEGALDALAEAVKLAAHPDLWMFNWQLTNKRELLPGRRDDA
ncbi:hypothetical protein [Dactylosporangium sp. NPDC006015]|uniref:hypothetical protein n=1 Tax=Dactylosporangium sp. NPDC006015 TaxID=3154576 RepID=UPI0033B99EB4